MLKCENCNKKFEDIKYKFCPYCGSKISEVNESQYNKLPKEYTSPYGNWRVTTEGDCEGKSVRNLGDYEGNIDEIALFLADKCYYSLCFQYIPKMEKVDLTRKRDSVNVMLDIKSQTWDMNKEVLVETMKDLFKGRPVEVDNCCYYASFQIKTKI